MVFNCTENDDECEANKLQVRQTVIYLISNLLIEFQACIIKDYFEHEDNWAILKREESFNLLNCIFKNRFGKDHWDAAELCGNTVLDPELITDVWHGLRSCARGLDGSNYLKEFIDYKASSSVELPQGTYLALKIDGNVQNEGITNLFRSVCGHFANKVSN